MNNAGKNTIGNTNKNSTFLSFLSSPGFDSSVTKLFIFSLGKSVIMNKRVNIIKGKRKIPSGSGKVRPGLSGSSYYGSSVPGTKKEAEETELMS